MYQQICSPIQWVVFSFSWWYPLLWIKLFSLRQSHLFIFLFFFSCLGWYIRKNIAMRNVQILLTMFFSSRTFMVSRLTFKSLIYFEFILVCGVIRWSSFIFLLASVQFSQNHLLHKLSLVHFIGLLPLSNTN